MTAEAENGYNPVPAKNEPPLVSFKYAKEESADNSYPQPLSTVETASPELRVILVLDCVR